MLGGVSSLSEAWSRTVASRVAAQVLAMARQYHRHEIDGDVPIPDEPVLFVGNHGFGTLTDPSVLAMAATLLQVRQGREATFLVHDAAWTFRMGPIVEALGGARAREGSAVDAWEAGRDVVVFPGGDIEAGKSWSQRNTVEFSGRSGFASMAMAHGIAIVPVVTVGAGETAFVFTDGQALASRLRLDRVMRYKVLPVSLSIPWGLSIGVAGFLPYFPLPSKLVTAVLPAMSAREGESAAGLAARVQQAMQDRMDELVVDRLPLFG